MALTVILILGALALNGWSLISLALHNPRHFHLGGGTADGKYRFEDAIAYSGNCIGNIDWLNWAGVYSSSQLCSKPVDIETLTGKAYIVTDSRGRKERVCTVPDVRIITGPERVISPVSADRIPLKDALSPPTKPVVDGMSLLSPPWVDTVRVIEPPPNTLVDLSSVNALILSHQSRMPIPQFVNLRPGDYITNHLDVTKGIHSTSVNEKRRVRIFVQDEPSIPKGIILDGCVVGTPSRRPADFQIWYNGTGPIRIVGHSHVECIIYAPHANLEIGPEVEFSGAIVCKDLHFSGGLIFFDKDLRNISDWR